MDKHKISKYYLIISLVTLVSVMVFIIQQSYSNLLADSKKISEDVTVKPLDPNIDIEVLDLIEKKLHFDPQIELPPPVDVDSDLESNITDL
jgi:hypothetical protein